MAEIIDEGRVPFQADLLPLPVPAVEQAEHLRCDPLDVRSHGVRQFPFQFSYQRAKSATLLHGWVQLQRSRQAEAPVRTVLSDGVPFQAAGRSSVFIGAAAPGADRASPDASSGRTTGSGGRAEPAEAERVQVRNMLQDPPGFGDVRPRRTGMIVTRLDTDAMPSLDDCAPEVVEDRSALSDQRSR